MAMSVERRLTPDRRGEPDRRSGKIRELADRRWRAIQRWREKDDPGHRTAPKGHRPGWVVCLRYFGSAYGSATGLAH